MKETESNSVCTNTPPAFSWDGDKETEETKPSDLQRQETNATTPSIVVEKRLAQRRTTEKAAVLDEVDAPSALGETSNQQHITTCRNSTDGDDSTDLLAEKERFAGRTSTSTAALQANERANAMLDYVDRKASIMEQDNNNISEESHYEEMMTQERKSILSERTAAAAGRGGGNHPANTNSPSLTNQGEQVQDRTSNNSNEEDVMDSREKNDPRRKNIATTSASVLEEKEQIIERNSPESLRANRNANMMLDYIARGEEASGNNTVDHHTHKGPRAASTNHVVGGSLDHHDNDLPMSNEQDTSIHSFPGSVRVAGIDIEREGSIRILSDMPDDPTDAAGDDRNSGLLVHAHVVNDDENNSGRMIDDNSKVLATATPDPWWRRHQWWLAVGAAIIVGAITVAIILTTVEFGTPNTESPSMAPTSYAEGIEDQTVQLIESVLPLEEVSRLSDVSSSQYSALRWVIAQRLENEDKTSYWDSMDIMRHYSLAVLFFGTGGLSSWMNSDGWLNSTSVCDWYGVQCSSLGDDGADDAAVTGLNLTSNGLNGTISSDIAILAAQLRLLDLSDNDLSGTIPEQVGRMTALTHLSLAENNLSGSFPPSFGSMTKLLNLDLSANSLGATLPTELGFLTSLGELHLDENELNGEIPSEVGQLTALENIGVSENRLSYGLPSELGRMPFLKSLDAHGNTLLGPLPTEIGLLGNLRRLDVSDNYFFDKIPSDLGRVTTLTSLDLSNNLFTGTLPPDFGVAMNQLSSLRVRGNFLEGIIDFRVLYEQSKAAEADVAYQLSHLVNVISSDDVLALDDLTELDLSSNLFTGSIPAVFYSLPRLESLNVSSNKLGGPMLQGLEIWQDLSSNLTVLDISSNVGLGPMPATIGILSNLNVLKTTSNFIGYLPTEIALLRNLITLDVSISECAAIPTILWSMTTLESLSIISERDPIANCPPPPIDASIPGEVGALTHLRELRITNSEGTIPSEFGLLTNLRSLDLVSIGLTGSLPSELGRLSLLTSLSMDGDGRNGLNGTLPTEIGMLKNAQILSAKYNSLSGSIPTEVTMLTQAESLDMQNNNIVGPLPSEMLGMMTNLKVLNLASNAVSGTLPTQLGMVTELKVLNLASNAVSGTLPTQLGMMTKLKVLNLDSNAVSGTLPTQLGMMTKLKVLNLDSNAVSGTLPTQLGVLSNLNTFLLGYNALRGQLPSEIGLVQDLVELSLEHNAYLNSTIPSEIGLLTSLTDLSLQSNSLSGSLPSELGLVTLLESLFMSNNFFTGSLPSELGRLANLFTLDLSNNTLSGMFISDSISDETCENSPSFTVDCEKVACRCCRCPTPSPSVQPSQSDAPTNTPTTSAPSSSPNPTEVPSLSFQPSLTFAPSSTARTCSMFSPIASTGSRLADVSDQDDGFEVVTLPFMFPWFGESMYNNVSVTSNGVVFPGVSLDNGCCSAQPIEMLGYYSIPRIAVAQMDLSPQNGNGAIYTSTHQLLSDGEDDDEAFIISWEDVQIYRVVADENNGGGLNFQVLLYANGNMEMRWGEGSTGGILLASGVEDDAANVTAPVTGLPYNRTDQPGVSDEWPQNQCRLFFKKTTLDGGLFGQVTSSGDNSG